MADEEILEEAAPAKKKKKEGGGFSFVYILIMLLLMVATAVVVNMIVQSKMKSMNDTVKTGVSDITRIAQTGVLKDVPPPQPCIVGEKSVNSIHQISTPEKPMIIALADGESYLSLGISICLGPDGKKAIEADAFNAQYRDIILHVVNEVMATKTKDFFFTKAVGTAPEGSGELEKEFYEKSPAEYHAQQVNEVADEVEENIRQMLMTQGVGRAANIPIMDIYITSFLIQ